MDDNIQIDFYEQRVSEILEKLKLTENKTLEQEALALVLYHHLFKLSAEKELKAFLLKSSGSIDTQETLLEELKSGQEHLEKSIACISEWKADKERDDVSYDEDFKEVKEDLTMLKKYHYSRGKFTWEKVLKGVSGVIALICAISAVNVWYLNGIFTSQETFKEEIADLQELTTKRHSTLGQDTSTTIQDVKASVKEEFERFQKVLDRKSIEDAKQMKLMNDLMLEFKLLNLKMNMLNPSMEGKKLTINQ